ncbi:hypothetical protein B0T21DRAFT_372173 [Apiosordaria backusii]|uniref:Uncharacterized protein n=1 Tax=Apiosordaria backusii TaxID=314023 RepID=A0AA40AX91_9PEZI|nr:hypothetical protein B0T21DRAFT_372173 [Apiosordaria backusii]
MSRSTFGVLVTPFILFFLVSSFPFGLGLVQKFLGGGKATITIPGVLWSFGMYFGISFVLKFLYFSFFLLKQECTWMVGWLVVVGRGKGERNPEL